jgi:RNA polymerase sigma-70 factor (ECF subfamily)
MMFSCCHPRLPEEAQVALVLQILCGFDTREIASAFLSSHAAIEKRITRAKKVLAGSKRLFDIVSAGDLATRLSAVHRALYLLFNEGYHGADAQSAVRVELCQEAMRLASMLLEHPATATPATHALLALMCLDAARMPARLDPSGHLAGLFEQDRSRWDRALLDQGLAHLDRSATGPELTEYHLEAAIAAVHARTRRAADTPWGEIVSLYDQLMAIRPSPVVALGRAIAIGEDEGPGRGLDAIREIADRDRLVAYPFYYAALGEFELRNGRHDIAAEHFRAALSDARNPTEREFFERRVEACAAR